MCIYIYMIEQEDEKYMVAVTLILLSMSSKLMKLVVKVDSATTSGVLL